MREKKLVIIMLTGLMLLGLTACDGNTDPDTQAITKRPCSEYSWGFRTCTVPMPDGRRITCITYAKGVSCDWTHDTDFTRE